MDHVRALDLAAAAALRAASAARWCGRSARRSGRWRGCRCRESPRAGCSSGNVLESAASTSGEALNSTQSTPSARDGDRRLRARLGAQRALAHAVAIAAVAVPLRETAAGGATQHSDAHLKKFLSASAEPPRFSAVRAFAIPTNEPARGVPGPAESGEPVARAPFVICFALAIGDVHGHFEAEAQIGELRFGPSHFKLLYGQVKVKSSLKPVNPASSAFPALRPDDVFTEFVRFDCIVEDVVRPIRRENPQTVLMIFMSLGGWICLAPGLALRFTTLCFRAPIPYCAWFTSPLAGFANVRSPRQSWCRSRSTRQH